LLKSEETLLYALHTLAEVGTGFVEVSLHTAATLPKDVGALDGAVDGAFVGAVEGPLVDLVGAADGVLIGALDDGFDELPLTAMPV